MKILNELELTPIEGGFNWRVDAPFDVMDDVLGKIEVPAGFISDLGSIPRILWNIVPPEGPATPAYLTHDYCYSQQFCTRVQADDCLLRLMTVLGVGRLMRYTVYLGVRTGGWYAWKQNGEKLKVTA